MEFWEFALIIPSLVLMYYMFFIRKTKPYRMSAEHKQWVENYFLLWSARMTLSMRNDEAWKLIQCYILFLLYIPLYNRFWKYPNFVRRDCFVMMSIQAVFFLTRGNTIAFFVCSLPGFLLMNWKNEVYYSPDDELEKEKVM